MYEIDFQSVFDSLQPVLPATWNKVVFYAGYTAGSYSMKYYVDLGNGQFMDCFNLPGANKGQIVKAFLSINRALSSNRKSLNGNNVWTVFTMIVDAHGNMKTEFDYTDMSENTIAYEKAWKKKYL